MIEVTDDELDMAMIAAGITGPLPYGELKRIQAACRAGIAAGLERAMLKAEQDARRIELTDAELDQINRAPLRTEDERKVARAAFRAGILAGLERGAKKSTQ